MLRGIDPRNTCTLNVYILMLEICETGMVKMWEMHVLRY